MKVLIFLVLFCCAFVHTSAFKVILQLEGGGTVEYNNVRPLHKSRFGQLFEDTAPDGVVRILKIAEETHYKAAFDREYRILQHLAAGIEQTKADMGFLSKFIPIPQIPLPIANGVVQSCQDDSTYVGKPILVMAMSDNSALIPLPLNTTMDNAERLKLEYQMLTSLVFVHMNSVVHGDLQAEDFMISKSGIVILTDYTSAWIMGQEEPTKPHAVNIYQSLQVQLLEGKTQNLLPVGCVVPELGQESDLESLAIITCSGRLPVPWAELDSKQTEWNTKGQFPGYLESRRMNNRSLKIKLDTLLLQRIQLQQYFPYNKDQRYDKEMLPIEVFNFLDELVMYSRRKLPNQEKPSLVKSEPVKQSLEIKDQEKSFVEQLEKTGNINTINYIKPNLQSSSETTTTTSSEPDSRGFLAKLFGKKSQTTNGTIG